MFARSISAIFKTNKKCIYKGTSTALFDTSRKQIRLLSTADPKDTATLDPLQYKIETCHGIFEDKKGKQRAEVELTNDLIKIFKVNHVNIIGSTFTSLLPDGPLIEILSKSFTLHKGAVDKYTIKFPMRIPISTNTDTGIKHEEGRLLVQVAVDQAEQPRQVFQLTLQHGDHVIKSEPAAKFGEALLDIQLQLPIKTYIRSCFMCAHAEYYPLSNAEFGTMGCFKDWSRIQSVKSQQELMFHWSQRSNQVQETYRCPSFRRRTRPHIAPKEGEQITTSSHEGSETTGAITEEKEWVKNS